MITFEPFPKLSRLSRGCVITEKLDGTNAQIIIEKCDGDTTAWANRDACYLAHTDDQQYVIAAGSRTRLITPGKTTDNYGFAGWVWDNAQELVKLGEGRHYGEWYGKGIQRGYGLTEKCFALFDTHKWPDVRPRPSCVSVVPILHHGEFTSDAIDGSMAMLAQEGSVASPGFMDPEGIVIFHEAARVSFKKTFDDVSGAPGKHDADESWKKVREMCS